jgi:hypothetical protein
MSTKIDFKEIERQTRRFFYQDGLIEIMMGIFLLLFAAMYESSVSFGVSLIAIFLMIPAWREAKRRYVFPRIGYVNLDDEEEAQAEAKGILKFLGFFFAFMIVAVTVFVWVWGGDLGTDYFYTRFIPVVIGLVMAIGPITMGYKNGIVRWYIFATLFVLIGVGVVFLGLETFYQILAIQMTACGVIPLATGLVMFLRFLKKYPVVEEEGGNGEG